MFNARLRQERAGGRSDVGRAALSLHRPCTGRGVTSSLGLRRLARGDGVPPRCRGRVWSARRPRPTRRDGVCRPAEGGAGARHQAQTGRLPRAKPGRRARGMVLSRLVLARMPARASRARDREVRGRQVRARCVQEDHGRHGQVPGGRLCRQLCVVLRVQADARAVAEQAVGRRDSRSAAEGREEMDIRRQMTPRRTYGTSAHWGPIALHLLHRRTTSTSVKADGDTSE
mmetsp:Transcript_118185/g.376748  ORF Transcript_118185/g.376748 Transcript_118185/m.376748 type:complete len:229 (+) Transcript_118185:619-1305(+)